MAKSMKLRTSVHIPPYPFQLSYSDKILCLGSCFADRIGQVMSEAKLPVVCNPIGIMYNPVSVGKHLYFAMGRAELAEPSLHQREKYWFSFDGHGTWYANSKDALAKKMASAQEEYKHKLQEARLLIVTFGTAWVYSLKQNDQIVANCHRYPARDFNKSCLDLAQVVDYWQALIEGLKVFNPDLQIMLTVSPVRHIKEGLANNMWSKALLRLACQQLVDQYKHLHYFPSFEMMIDDLRDYRFYTSDLIHPNDMAIDYIWQAFRHVIFSADAIGLMDRWSKLKKSLMHRPLFPASEAYQDHLEKLIDQLEAISKELDVSEELTATKSRLESSK